jgi:hypothetical protein
MAAAVIARGIARPSGGRWHGHGVLRVMERAARYISGWEPTPVGRLGVRIRNPPLKRLRSSLPAVAFRQLGRSIVYINHKFSTKILALTFQSNYCSYVMLKRELGK